MWKDVDCGAVHDIKTVWLSPATVRKVDEWTKHFLGLYINVFIFLSEIEHVLT